MNPSCSLKIHFNIICQSTLKSFVCCFVTKTVHFWHTHRVSSSAASVRSTEQYLVFRRANFVRGRISWAYILLRGRWRVGRSRWAFSHQRIKLILSTVSVRTTARIRSVLEVPHENPVRRVCWKEMERRYIQRPTVGTESLCENSNDNGVRAVVFNLGYAKTC